MGPNELAWLEAGMASLTQTRLSTTERYEACLAIVSVIRTCAQFSSSVGVSREQWAREARKVIASRPGYRELDALLRTARRSVRLERSIAWVLDGIATHASGGGSVHQ